MSLVPSTCQAINLLRSFIGRDTTAEVGTKWRQELGEAVGELDLLDLNYALYRCDQEERDDGHGGGAYVVPGAGAFIYCGVEGIMSMMKTVRDNNDLGHPLCDNLRSGDWLAGYSVNRLRLRTGTKKVTRTHHERKPTYVTIYCYSRRESKGVCIQYSNIDCEYTEHSITTVSPSLSVCVLVYSWQTCWTLCSRSYRRSLATSYPATSRPYSLSFTLYSRLDLSPS